MPILREKDNASENFGPHEDEESRLEEQDIKEDHTNLVSKNFDTGSYIRDALSRCSLQNGFLASELSSSLKKVRFSK